MRLVLSLVVAVVTVQVFSACAERAAAQVPDVPGWQLIFNDNFDGTSINTNNWVPLDRQNSQNQELQYYYPDQVTVGDGNLKLEATNVPRGNKLYQSGLVTSKIPYGLLQTGSNHQALRFEARIDLPTTQGMWPAFWLNPNELIGWPKGGEIDILENRGSQPTLVSSAYHWQVSQTQPCCNGHQYVFRERFFSGDVEDNYHNAFHTYAVEWEPTRLRFFVDDVMYHELNETSGMPIYEFSKYIILNLAVGGHFGGNPNDTTIFPQEMLVDYVRVWTKQTGLAGDYNGDGAVDAADYTVWRDSNGQSGLGLPADGSGNGSIGTEDYDVWRAAFGDDDSAGAAPVPSETVPEPTSAIPLTIGLMLVYSQRVALSPIRQLERAALFDKDLCTKLEAESPETARP